MIRPSTSPITTPFGYVRGYPLHNGVHYGLDFAYEPDDRVYAPFSGKVTCKPLNGDDGNAIYMWRGDYFIGLCHLQQFLVASEDEVVAGQVIGIMGDTGAAEGRHLHFAVMYRSEFIDPETVITKEVPMADTSTKSTQEQLDLMTFKFNESEKALRAREEQATQQQAVIDLTNYKLSQSEAALRSREEQAAEYEKQIADLEKQVADLQAGAGFVEVTDPLYKKK